MWKTAMPWSAAASSLLGAVGNGLDEIGARLADAARVARYLRGLNDFVSRGDDIYVVSYPRSGTTWTQFALYLLTSDGRIDFDHISQVVPWFERSLALGIRTAEDFNALPSPRVFKSHLPLSWLPRQGQCVYLQRGGMDVAVSYYHFYRSHLGFDGPFERFFERFMRGELQYGSWFKHVAGWRARAGDRRVLVLDFERLKADATACLREIVAHCGLEHDEASLAAVAEGCSFDNMKRDEDRFDHATDILLQRGIRRGAFIRKGKVGEGRTTLDDAQRAAFERVAARPPRLPQIELDLPAFLH